MKSIDHVVLVAVLVAVASARPGSNAAAPQMQHAKPQLYHVAIGVDTRLPALIVHTFLPAKLTIHVGDSVAWTNAVGQEPQTVTFGPPEYIPPLITARTGQEISPVVVRPQGGHIVGNTSLHVYSSGALMSGVRGLSTTYTFTFRTPGIYLYRSLFHPAATGEIDVVAANRPASPNPANPAPDLVATLRAAARAQGADVFAGQAASGSNAVNVALGYGNDTVTINRFSPQSFTIAAGSTVTWKVVETTGDIHAIVFNPTPAENAGNAPLYTGRSADGGLTINPAYTQPNLTSAVVTTDTARATQGHIVSGILYTGDVNNPSAVPSTFALTFQAPATYYYVDPFHGGMSGQIRVTP